MPVPFRNWGFLFSAWAVAMGGPFCFGVVAGLFAGSGWEESRVGKRAGMSGDFDQSNQFYGQFEQNGVGSVYRDFT